MQIKNQEQWNSYLVNNRGGYGEAVISYAKRWANMLEDALRSGEHGDKMEKVLSAVGDETSHKADTEGITGFMYGAAVQILSECWQYGDELRVWHNASYGIGSNETRVVNPALLGVDVHDT